MGTERFDPLPGGVAIGTVAFAASVVFTPGRARKKFAFL
jgi:hypothetical protein